MPFFELESPRLFFRPLSEDDLKDLHEIFGDPEAVTWVGDGKADASIEETAQRLQKLLLRRHEPGKSLWWSAIDKASSQMLGLGILQDMPDESGQMEVGYHLKRSEWGKGYGTETARMIVKAAFTVMEQKEVVAVTHPENELSKKVLGKIGFEHQGKGEYRGKSVERYLLKKPANPNA